MSTINAEAYVINDDGSKTTIPVDLVDSRNGNNSRSKTSEAAQAAQSYRRWYTKRAECGCAGASSQVNAHGYSAQSPFTTVNAQTTAPRRSLHLGRRIAGLGVAAIGVPLLILPGPGLALIGLGLLMVVMP